MSHLQLLLHEYVSFCRCYSLQVLYSKLQEGSTHEHKLMLLHFSFKNIGTFI